MFHFHLFVFQQERVLSDEHSSLLNRAFSTLAKPLTRGLYLLQLRGISIEETDIQMDPDFLMEIMEVNEALATTNDGQEIKDIGDKNRVVLDKMVSDFAKAYEGNELEKAKVIICKMKYYANIEDKVKEFEMKNAGFM